MTVLGLPASLLYMTQHSHSGLLTNNNYPYQKNPVGIWCNRGTLWASRSMTQRQRATCATTGS